MKNSLLFVERQDGYCDILYKKNPVFCAGVIRFNGLFEPRGDICYSLKEIKQIYKMMKKTRGRCKGK